jgi:tetratricopeptide (TPR) repeat protein
MRIVLLIAFSLLAQHPTATNDEPAIRAVVEQYFAAYEKRDLEAFMSLWTGLEADRQRTRMTMEARFKSDQSTFTPRTVSRLDLRFSAADVCVKTERTTKPLQGAGERRSAMHVCWTLAKEDAWRIVREQPAVSAFAARFQQASEEQRGKLLETESELVTPELAHIMAGTSESWMARQQYAAALQSHVALRHVLTKLNDKPALADAWHESGVAYQALKRYTESVEAFTAALRLNTELKREKRLAATLTNLAATHRLAQQFELALARYDEALKLFLTLNQPEEVGGIREAIALVHYEHGDYERALQSYRESLQPAEPLTMAVANRRLRLAQIAYESGDSAAAEASFKQTLAEYEKLGFRKSHGFIHHSLANLFYSQGDYGQAVRYYQQSLAIEQANQDENAQASAWQGIGLAHTFNGNYAAALAAFEQQLGLWTKRNDALQIAAAKQRIASTYFSMNQLAEALPVYEEVAVLRAKLGNANEHGRALLDLGITLAALGKHEEALQRYEQSHAQFTAAQQPLGIAHVLINTSMLRWTRQEYDLALRDAESAVALARAARDNDTLWQALYRQGKAQFRLQQLAAARATLNEAVTVAESQRSTAWSGLLLQQADQRLRPHQALLDVLIALNLGDEAFHLSERIKTRELFHILRNGRLWVTHGMTAPEREREAQHLKTLALLNAQIARENEKQQPNRTRLAALREQRRAAETSYDAFLRALYQAHPRLAALRSETAAVKAARAAALVPDARTAVLSYAESDDTLYLFAFTKASAKQAAGLQIYHINAHRSLFEAQFKEHGPQLPQTLRELLWQPAQAQLAGKSQFILSPSRILWNVNFAALVGAKDEQALRYAPSLTAWQTANRQPRALRQPQAVPLTILHSPQWSDETRARWQHAGGATSSFNFTPPAAKQAAKILIGADARLSQIGDSLHLHLAVPFLRSEYSPLFSAFVLSDSLTPPESGRPESGWIELRALPWLKTARQRVSFLDATAGLHEGRAWIGAYWALLLSGSQSIQIVSAEASMPTRTFGIARP